MGTGRTGSVEHRAKRPVRAGRFLARVAGLLVVLLAVLALPAAPPAACGGDGGGQDRHAVLGGASDRVAAAAATPVLHGQEHPDRGHGAPASAACCVAFRCPMLLVDLPPAPAGASPPAGSSARVSIAVRRLDGLDVPPVLPPPRDVA